MSQIRHLIALVFVTASHLKFYDYFYSPQPASGIWATLVSAPLISVVEISLAAWLISRYHYTLCNRLVTFFLFSLGLYAAFLGISGQSSCGCFGVFKVSPWLTMILDWTLALLLAKFDLNSNEQVLRWPLVFATIFIILICILTSIRLTHPSYREGLIKVGDSWILNHNSWNQKPFPIQLSNNQGQTDSHQWLLIVHADCLKCQRELSQLSTAKPVVLSLTPNNDGLAGFDVVHPVPKGNYIAEVPLWVEIKNGVVNSTQSQRPKEFNVD